MLLKHEYYFYYYYQIVLEKNLLIFKLLFQTSQKPKVFQVFQETLRYQQPKMRNLPAC